MNSPSEDKSPAGEMREELLMAVANRLDTTEEPKAPIASALIVTGFLYVIPQQQNLSARDKARGAA